MQGIVLIGLNCWKKVKDYSNGMEEGRRISRMRLRGRGGIRIELALENTQKLYLLIVVITLNNIFSTDMLILAFSNHVYLFLRRFF